MSDEQPTSPVSPFPLRGEKRRQALSPEGEEAHGLVPPPTNPFEHKRFVSLVRDAKAGGPIRR
jgi:hypothetical protein